MSIHLFGSNYIKWSTPGTPPDYSLDEFATAIETEGSDRIGYICDDLEQWGSDSGYVARLNDDWINRGFSFGIEPSGSDSLLAGSAPNGPVRIQYDGVESNPTLTISNNGVTWALTTTEGADNATWSDVSASTVYKTLKYGLLLGDVVGADGINEELNWTASINPFYGGAFDDAYSESLADGTFVLTGSPPETTEPEFDQLRRKELEIDYGLSVALATGLSTNYSKVFYNPSWSSANTTVETFLKTQSTYTWSGIMGYYVGFDPTDSASLIAASIPIASINPWKINNGLGLEGSPSPSTTYFKGDIATYDAMTATEREHRIRLAAKGLSCEAAGGFVPIVFPFSSATNSELWSPEEIVWLINELKSQDVQIISMDEAVTLTGG